MPSNDDDIEGKIGNRAYFVKRHIGQAAAHEFEADKAFRNGRPPLGDVQLPRPTQGNRDPSQTQTHIPHRVVQQHAKRRSARQHVLAQDRGIDRFTTAQEPLHLNAGGANLVPAGHRAERGDCPAPETPRLQRSPTVYRGAGGRPFRRDGSLPADGRRQVRQGHAPIQRNQSAFHFNWKWECALAIRNHAVSQAAAAAHFNPDLVADLEKLAARHTDAGRCTGGDDIARLQRHVTAEIGDLFGHVMHEARGV